VSTIWFVVIVAGLGGLGSMLRFALSRFTGILPWGILTANTLASLIAGLFLSGLVPAVPYAFLAVGFAGGLSTFSSWAAQTGAFWQTKQYRKATYNAALNLILPMTAVIAGGFASITLLK